MSELERYGFEVSGDCELLYPDGRIYPGGDDCYIFSAYSDLFPAYPHIIVKKMCVEKEDLVRALKKVERNLWDQCKTEDLRVWRCAISEFRMQVEEELL